MAHDAFQTHCDLAKQALARGDTPAACQQYQQALALNPDAPAVHYGLATAYYLLRDWENAAAHFQHVARLQPDSASVHVNLGAVFKQLNRLQDAEVALKKSIQIAPGRSEAHHNLATIYRLSGKTELARDAYLEALRLDPRMYDAHFYLAMIHQDANDLPKAITHLQKALELRPAWPRAAQALLKLESAVAPTPAPATPLVDPERLLDPKSHGAAMQAAHSAVISLQERAEELLNILRQEMESALLQLSKGLNRRVKDPVLQDYIKKYDAAMARVRLARESFHQTSAQVQRVGEDLLSI